MTRTLLQRVADAGPATGTTTDTGPVLPLLWLLLLVPFGCTCKCNIPAIAYRPDMLAAVKAAWGSEQHKMSTVDMTQRYNSLRSLCCDGFV